MKLLEYLKLSKFNNNIALRIDKKFHQSIIEKVQGSTLYKYFEHTKNPIANRDLQSECEIILYTLFKKILKLKKLKINDDFFELGGNSLNASELIFAIYKQIGFALDHRSIILAPCVRELSALIDRREKQTDYFLYYEFFKKEINYTQENYT